MSKVIEICQSAREIEGIKIIRFESSIFYANIERFEFVLKKKSGINPYIYFNEIETVRKKHAKMAANTKDKPFYYKILFKRRVKPTDENDQNKKYLVILNCYIFKSFKL